MTQLSRKQRTISKPVKVTGFGYWSGQDVRVQFRPAEPHTGIVFVRGDLEPPKRIPAELANRIETPRRTTLTCEGTTVEMVEHVMAALAGLRIDNCEVWADSPEMPGGDGSSQAFVEAIDAAGIVVQNAVRRQLVIRDVTRVGDEVAWVEARPARSPEMLIQCYLDYDSLPVIGCQTIEVAVTPDSFRSELARARTFISKQEAEWLLSQGLGKRVSYADVLVFDRKGPIENPLRFEDECVRHKVLDLVGDLALAGSDLVGHFVAHRSGHRLNTELVRRIVSNRHLLRDRRRSA